MSTHVLGNVQLVTKQEVEALLEAVVTPKEDIDSMIDKATAVFDAALAGAKKGFEEQVAELQSNLANEKEAVIESAVERLNEMKKDDMQMENVICTRLVNLPIAQLTIELHDQLLHRNDTVASLSDEYHPKIPVAFSLVAELIDADDENARAYYGVTLRLDSDGNIKVVDLTKLTDTYVGNINTASVMYITEE
ncbi:hypothetical protein HDR60_03010 [bacterium]|nr:hypothetical protein [bacterium]